MSGTNKLTNNNNRNKKDADTANLLRGRGSP